MAFDTAIIGLGYVGLPLAQEASKVGLKVLGFDVSQRVVDGLNSGRSHVDDLSDDDIAEMREAGFTAPVAIAYSDSTADLPLLLAAKAPVVVNPKPGRVEFFRRVLPAGTRILNWGCVDRGGEKA